MSTGERTPYEILAVQVGMAKKALCGNANATHEQLKAACDERLRALKSAPAPAALKCEALEHVLERAPAAQHPGGVSFYSLEKLGEARREYIALREAASGAAPAAAREAVRLEAVIDAAAAEHDSKSGYHKVGCRVCIALAALRGPRTREAT